MRVWKSGFIRRNEVSAMVIAFAIKRAIEYSKKAAPSAQPGQADLDAWLQENG
jgi:hypothetical protein